MRISKVLFKLLPILLLPAFALDGSPERPNIIWIYADDHDQAAISAYGSELIETPHIDRLAREGTRFANSFVTNSICAPARAVILTGKFSHRNGHRDNKSTFDGSQRTFPKLLREAGYQTAITGKWHLKSEPTGFDYWKVMPGQGRYYDPEMIDNGERVVMDGYNTDVTVDMALNWLETLRDPDKPFSLMVQFKAPHGPWMPAPRHLGLYRDVALPVPESFFADLSLKGPPALRQDMEIYSRFMENKTLPKLYDKAGDSVVAHRWFKGMYQGMDPRLQDQIDAAFLEENRAFLWQGLPEREAKLWMYQRYIKNYLRCVAAIDENVGRLLDYLDATDLAENTVVMYSSDQGFWLGENGWYDKRFMYEKSMRTPLLVRWPGVTRPGTVQGEMVQNVDMAQTFLEIAGLEAPEDMQGESLVPLLRDADAALTRDALYYHYYEFPTPHHVYPHYGIRTQTQKLIYFYTLDHWEFYDLVNDPTEAVNQAGNPVFADEIAGLKRRLTDLREYYGDDEG